MRKFRKALITGITGSAGSYLAEYILAHHKEVEIHGITRKNTPKNVRNVIGFENQITLYECDLTDFSSIFSVLRESQPDVIFHLASYANVRQSFRTPLSVIQNNFMSTANLLEAIRLLDIHPIVQHCSTSEVYGQVLPDELPITENHAIRPVNPYSVSKTMQDMMAGSYYYSYRMNIIRTRMFGYLNPRRPDIFASSFARQVVQIELGLKKELIHGNLDSIRTLLDVHDAMESYWVACEHCKIGEVYNIGNEQPIRVGEFLEVLKSHSKVPIVSRVDKELLRPVDVTLQIPSMKKFQDETGWKPKYSFEESVEHLLNYWREQVPIELKHSQFMSQ